MRGGWTTRGDRAPLALEPARRPEPTDGPRPACDEPPAVFHERRAVFLDRDGVLNATVKDPESGLFESPLQLADLRLLPGVAAALRRLQRAGYLLVCVSNQPVAAKGKTSLDELLALHERVLALLAAQGARVEVSRLCPHHPDGVVEGLSGACACRKPAPGMLLDAARAQGIDLAGSWMLGDTDSDVEAGQAAGCQTVLIEYPSSAHKRLGGVRPDLRAVDLPTAVSELLERDSSLPQPTASRRGS